MSGSSVFERWRPLSYNHSFPHRPVGANKHSWREVYQLTFGASVVLSIHADTPIFVRMWFFLHQEKLKIVIWPWRCRYDWNPNKHKHMNLHSGKPETSNTNTSLKWATRFSITLNSIKKMDRWTKKDQEKCIQFDLHIQNNQKVLNDTPLIWLYLYFYLNTYALQRDFNVRVYFLRSWMFEQVWTSFYVM